MQRGVVYCNKTAAKRALLHSALSESHLRQNQAIIFVVVFSYDQL